MALEGETTVDVPKEKKKFEAEEDFWPGFYQSFILMLLSEICDRSFIMVTIFATKLNKIGVFIVGSVLMTMMQILAVIIGQIFPFLLQQNLTHIIAVFLFFAFGFYMLYAAFFKTSTLMSSDEEEREILDEIANKEALNQPLMPDSESQIV